MNLIRLSPSASCESGVSSTQLQRGLGHIEHRRSQLASRPAVYVIEDDSSINAGFDQTQGEEEEAGNGLGRSEDGIKEAIKVKIKNDTTGVGHDPGKEFSNHWWDQVFNKAANSIQVHNSEEGVHVTTVPAKSKKDKKKAAKDLLYGNFRKASTLTISENGVVETKVDRESSDSEEDTTQNLARHTDEDLFKLCGSRTAHKGARHGLKLSGKLQRLEEQERLAAAHESTPHETADTSQRKKRKKKTKHVDESSTNGSQACESDIQIQKPESDGSVKKRKKQKESIPVKDAEPVLHPSKRKHKKKKHNKE